MRNSCIFILLLCAGFAYAQNTSSCRPFIETGKTWKVEHLVGFPDPSVDYVERFYFGGDTIVSGQACTILLCDTEKDGSHRISYEAALFEEGGRVSFFAPGESSPQLLYDFGSEAGETVYVTKPRRDTKGEAVHSTCLISSIQEVNTEDADLTCVCFIENGDGRPYRKTFWMDGIGSLAGPIYNCHFRQMNVRMRCIVGETCIYDSTSQDLVSILMERNAYDTQTFIHDLSAPEMVNGQSSNGKWYDLCGRRLSESPASSVPSVLPKGVYIKDGKKVMVK